VRKIEKIDFFLCKEYLEWNTAIFSAFLAQFPKISPLQAIWAKHRYPQTRHVRRLKIPSLLINAPANRTRHKNSKVHIKYFIH
jgi:hypothetical protein